MSAQLSGDSHRPQRLKLPPAPVIYINGWCGVGKATIARLVAEILTTEGHRPINVINRRAYDQIDNLAGNLLLKHSGRWGHLRQRMLFVFLDALATDPATFGTIYIFTAFQRKPLQDASQHLQAARRRGSMFIPIILECASSEEHMQRMNCRERVMRLQKDWEGWWDVQQLDARKSTNALECFEGEREAAENALVLDVGKLKAEEAAWVIVGHIKRVMWDRGRPKEPTVKSVGHAPREEDG